MSDPFERGEVQDKVSLMTSQDTMWPADRSRLTDGMNMLSYRHNLNLSRFNQTELQPVELVHIER
jgi:hypothetical protein